MTGSPPRARTPELLLRGGAGLPPGEVQPAPASRVDPDHRVGERHGRVADLELDRLEKVARLSTGARPLLARPTAEREPDTQTAGVLRVRDGRGHGEPVGLVGPVLDHGLVGAPRLAHLVVRLEQLVVELEPICLRRRRRERPGLRRGGGRLRGRRRRAAVDVVAVLVRAVEGLVLAAGVDLLVRVVAVATLRDVPDGRLRALADVLREGTVTVAIAIRVAVDLDAGESLVRLPVAVVVEAIADLRDLVVRNARVRRRIPVVAVERLAIGLRLPEAVAVHVVGVGPHDATADGRGNGRRGRIGGCGGLIADLVSDDLPATGYGHERRTEHEKGNENALHGQNSLATFSRSPHWIPPGRRHRAHARLRRRTCPGGEGLSLHSPLIRR